MLCPICKDAGQRSIVRITNNYKHQHRQPKEHFFDEDGHEHYHDPNIIRTDFGCSHGHHFSEISSWQCHVCGYKVCDARLLYGQTSEPRAEVAP
jgi:hypothetical protein